MITRFSAPLLGTLSMMACAFLWSVAGLFIKILDWNPFLIAGMRSLIAFLFLLTIVRTVRLAWSWPLVGAALANAATMLLFVAANKTTTAANAILLQYLAPVFTAILSVVILKEHIRREQLIALFLTPVGLALLFLDRLSAGQLFGNLLALTSACTFALLFIFTRMQKEGDPLQSLMASHAVAALIALSVAIFLPIPRFTPGAIGSILVLGVLQIGLAAVFFSYGIKRVSAVTANLIALIEPVFNPVWVFLLLGEAPSAQAILGGVLIIGSVTAASLISGWRTDRGEHVTRLRRASHYSSFSEKPLTLIKNLIHNPSIIINPFSSRPRMVTLIRSGFLLLLLLSGCGWDGTPTRKNDFVPLTSIEISAVSSTIAAQTSITLTATGNRSGLFTEDVTDQVVWSSDAPTVASFPYATSPNKNRVVGGLAPGGTATITAKVGSVSADFTLKVSDATVTSMVITDVPTSLPKGRTSQLKVTGTFTDLTTQDLTFDAVWTSTPGTFATVSNDPASKGLVTALAEGSETITATFGSIPATTAMTITAPVLQSISISPANPSILTLSTRNFTATGAYSDGSTPDITSQVAWSSSQPGIATVTAGGAATALTQGTTSISASLNGINGTTNLKVTGGNLIGIAVTPATVTLVKDISRPISAKGTFSNGSTRDITGAVQWTVANASASVTPSGGNLALLNPLALTSVPTTITATSGTLTGTAALTVVAPQPTSIAFSATTLELTAGTSIPLAVIATFSNGSTQDVTALSAVTPNNPAIAMVVAGGLATKRVTGVAAGTTTISATYGGLTVTAPATVSVISRTLQSLTISPTTSTVNVGNQAQFTATATYVGGTTVDVTNETETVTVWTANNQNIAILADKANQPGLIVGVDIGSTNLTASFGGKTPTQTTTITVTGP